MIEDPVTKSLKPFDFDHLIDNVPKLRMLNYEIEHLSLNPPIDSSDMLPENWRQICSAIDENYDRYDGFVVLHGTDTMAYTASALSFMLENLTKPVIITGSQLPIGEVRTDGEENLITAIQIAAERDSKGEPMIQEVAILFENYLWRGNRSTKMSADNFNAFRSNNYPPLAHIGLGIHYYTDSLYRPDRSRPLTVHYGLDSDVMYISLFPGISERILNHLLNTPGIKGVVMKTYGAGNTPTAPWFTKALSDAVARGLIILNVTQCINGSVHKRYVSADQLEAIGVISGGDLTSEAAITKMMHLFAMNLTHDEIKRRLGKSLCGEMSPPGAIPSSL